MARSLALILFLPWMAQAVSVPEAYLQAASRWQVPPELLWAVAQTESGSRLGTRYLPWPWTLNIAGKSYRYRSQKAACEALKAAAQHVSLKRIDVGLGQINLGWQRDYVVSFCDALSPCRNLSLSARLLRLRYNERPGSWLNAAARYHRPAGGEAAARYRQQVARMLKQRTQMP